jgi:DNA polymerase III delta prime subunit
VNQRRYEIVRTPYYRVFDRTYPLDIDGVEIGAIFVVDADQMIDEDGDVLGHVEGEDYFQHVNRECLRLIEKPKKRRKVSSAAVLKAIDSLLEIDEETAERVLRVAKAIDKGV